MTRKRNDSWQKDWSTDAEIKKVMSGEYKVTKIEIFRGKRVQERYYWYINLVITFKKPVKQLNTKITGGLDVGVLNPVICAIHNGLNRLSIRDNDVVNFTKAEVARLRSQRKGDRFRRSGHGKKHKFSPSEKIEQKYDLRRKKKMEEWTSRVVKFFLNTGVGLVYIEDIDAKSLKEGDDYFKTQLRVTWPVKEMLNMFKRKLEENGIIVKDRNPAFSSQICSKCGKWNNYFNFKYRKDNGYPPFKCRYCGFGNDEIIYGDYNAAKNLANPDFEKVVQQMIPKEVREKYIKEKNIADN